MATITHWTAKRAGGRITIYGTNHETGGPIRVVGVDKIEKLQHTDSHPTATDKDGRAHRLL